MVDLLNKGAPPKGKAELPEKPELPEPKDGKAIPAVWAQRAKFRRYRGAMKFAGIPLDRKITEKEFTQACDAYKKLPGNWYLNPDKYLKKVVK
jgi:hypothetical protein